MAEELDEVGYPPWCVIDIENRFVYDADERIYKKAATHSPKDGHELKSWLQRVREANQQAE